MPDMNKETGLPHELSLGDVFNDIKLSPAHVAALLHSMAYTHVGGPNDEMARKLMQHGNRVSDPATYGGAPQDNPQARWGQPQTAQQAQSDLPASGTTREPSWMADARAAGWAGPDDSAKQQADLGSPNTAQPGGDRARHYDDARRQWVFNDTGEPVDMPNNAPPQPTPPPATSTAPAGQPAF